MTTRELNIIECFSKVVLHGEPIELLVNRLKTEKSAGSLKYAFQAFCCAVLSKQSNTMLQKRKYIQQYAEFINKAMVMDQLCFETRLIRFLIEKNLVNVQFESHQSVDGKFLSLNLAAIEDQILVEIASKALSNE